MSIAPAADPVERKMTVDHLHDDDVVATFRHRDTDSVP